MAADRAGLKTHCHAIDIACIGAGAYGHCADVIGMSNWADGDTAFFAAAGCHRIGTNRYRFRGYGAGICADGNAFFPVCSGFVTDGNDIFTRLISCGSLIAHRACVLANYNGMTCRCQCTRTDCNRIVERVCFGVTVNFWLDTRLRTDGNTIWIVCYSRLLQHFGARTDGYRVSGFCFCLSSGGNRIATRSLCFFSIGNSSWCSRIIRYGA